MASVEKSSCPSQKRALKPPLPTSTHVESSKSKADVRHILPANQPRVAIPRCRHPFTLSAMMVLQKPGVMSEFLPPIFGIDVALVRLYTTTLGFVNPESLTALGQRHKLDFPRHSCAPVSSGPPRSRSRRNKSERPDLEPRSLL
ncbi:hypothetical protein E4U30_003514 [Claviceps sp. LM220 group G6]|nr:hypothetical protein E4U30_003514 [Claviceps sp. LM220 group G6]